jgi:hypothetical protein
VKAFKNDNSIYLCHNFLSVGASKHQGRDVGSRGAGRHINMRNTQLTYLLQDSLGGNSKTTMLAGLCESLFSDGLE